VRRFTFWAVALAVLVIVVFNVQGWLVLARTSRVLEKELGDRLQAVATTLATVLSGPTALRGHAFQQPVQPVHRGREPRLRD
jgi:sensor histidine kinase regulating citrate/malate metabolism